jgi:hypothetical protein
MQNARLSLIRRTDSFIPIIRFYFASSIPFGTRRKLKRVTSINPSQSTQFIPHLSLSNGLLSTLFECRDEALVDQVFVIDRLTAQRDSQSDLLKKQLLRSSSPLHSCAEHDIPGVMEALLRTEMGRSLANQIDFLCTPLQVLALSSLDDISFH